MIIKNMSTEKKQSKSLNKIHRRKNQEIQKEFQCTEQGCAKAYGSYAALYTHIKNKHANAKLPEMKYNIGKTKTGRKGRPQAKQQFSPLKQEQSIGQAQCRLCRQTECVCVQDYDSEQKNKIIQIMKNEDFVTIVNEIGNLSIQDKFTWVRNTEDDFDFLSQSDIYKMIQDFNRKHQSEIRFSQSVVQILSFTSRFWDRILLQQLYEAILIIRLKKGKKEILQTLEKESDKFTHMIQCSNVKKSQFEQFCNIIKII